MFLDEPSCDLVPPSFWRCSCRRCCYPGSMHGVGVEDAAVRGTEDGADTPAQTGQMRMNSKPAPAPAAAPARHRYPPPSTPCLVRPTFGILGHLRTAQSCLASTNPLSLPDSTAPAPEGIAPGDSGPPRRLETLAPTPAFKITLADHHNATPLSFPCMSCRPAAVHAPGPARRYDTGHSQPLRRPGHRPRRRPRHPPHHRPPPRPRAALTI